MISEAQTWRKRICPTNALTKGLPQVLTRVLTRVLTQVYTRVPTKVGFLCVIIPYKGSRSSAHVSAHAGRCPRKCTRSGLVAILNRALDPTIELSMAGGGGTLCCRLKATVHDIPLTCVVAPKCMKRYTIRSGPGKPNQRKVSS